MKKLRVTVDGKAYDVMVEILDEGGHPDDLDAAPAGEDGAAGGPEVFGYDTLRELQAALRVPDADGATSTSG